MQNTPVIYFGDGDSANPSFMNCPVFNNITYCVYNSAHTYPGPGQYSITVSLAPRISGIINISNSQNTTLFLSNLLVINPLLFQSNDSPIGSGLLYDQALINSAYVYNAGVYDNEGDSLSYHLTACSQQTSYPQATTSFTIDSLTGDVIWNMPFLSGPHNFCMIIKEWRKINNTYYMIGYTQREIEVEVVPFISVSENISQTNISVFPNPASNEISFLVSGITGKESVLIITDVSGKEFKHVKAENRNNEIDLTNLSPGMYYYNLNGSTGKFIVSE